VQFSSRIHYFFHHVTTLALVRELALLLDLAQRAHAREQILPDQSLQLDRLIHHASLLRDERVLAAFSRELGGVGHRMSNHHFTDGIGHQFGRLVATLRPALPIRDFLQGGQRD
jgi:hypothetical protein